MDYTGGLLPASASAVRRMAEACLEFWKDLFGKCTLTYLFGIEFRKLP